jgi:sterol desaturase/sphingolipid hydroxylase (fatty acid hydroxylase superfamily)
VGGSLLLFGALIPGAALVFLALGEWLTPREPGAPRHRAGDWLLNLSGFAFQGWLVPVAGWAISEQLLGRFWPTQRGALQLGPVGAFLLAFVGVDLLYYLQHRAFHRVPWLWALHRCHHASRALDVWVTSRNTLALNLLFVYLLLNPILIFLCASPTGFVLGVQLTAALDLWRHSRIRFEGGLARGLARVLVLPRDHHWHHSADHPDVNFGANLIVWDVLFGTALRRDDWPARYGVEDARTSLQQLLFPFVGGAATPEPGGRA